MHHKIIEAWYIEDLSNRDETVVMVVKLNRNEKLTSGNLDRNEDAVQPWLTQALDYATLHGYALLIGMDSNWHSELYGNKTNKRGKAIEEFIGHCKPKEITCRKPGENCTSPARYFDPPKYHNYIRFFLVNL